MPSNKDFQRRIEILDACLRRRQKNWTMQLLLEEVNEKLNENFGKSISIRSLYADMNYLNKEMDAPIEKYKKGNQTCYRYADPDYSVKNLPIGAEDLNLLKDAMELLSQVHGFSIADDMRTVVNKLENTIATNIEGRNAYIQFEKNTLAVGTHWLEDLFEAVKGKCVLNVAYQPFGKEERNYFFHPYLLKEYRNRWFLIGRVEGKDVITTLALDRIIKLKPVRNQYLENNLFDPATYYDHVIGVTIQENAVVEDVILEMDDSMYPYILTKPLHETQLLLPDINGKKRVSLRLINNHEFRALILSYGPGLKVIGPESLGEQMKQLYLEGMRVYDEISVQK